jgi:hypothetical protein
MSAQTIQSNWRTPKTMSNVLQILGESKFRFTLKESPTNSRASSYVILGFAIPARRWLKLLFWKQTTLGSKSQNQVRSRKSFLVPESFVASALPMVKSRNTKLTSVVVAIYFCCGGDLLDDEQNTYAPVVHWPTLRILLTLVMIFGWTTCSINFDSAFVQASLKDLVWIHVPRGFRSSKGDKMCLKLEQSQYGLTITPTKL